MMRHKRFALLGILTLTVGAMLFSATDAEAGRRHRRCCYDPCWNSCYTGYDVNSTCCGNNWGYGGYTPTCCMPGGGNMSQGQTMQGQPMRGPQEAPTTSPAAPPAAPQTNPLPPAPADANQGPR